MICWWLEIIDKRSLASLSFICSFKLRLFFNWGFGVDDISLISAKLAGVGVGVWAGLTISIFFLSSVLFVVIDWSVLDIIEIGEMTSTGWEEVGNGLKSEG